MEWKLLSEVLCRNIGKVLIVPCGMETRNASEQSRQTAEVLIVPCGMETDYCFDRLLPEEVLIVPCGMET